MRRVVISQSMLFPWVGMLEQVRLADVFVHYDDVQFSKGSFTNRVQVKTATGMQWMTVPLSGHHLGQTIAETRIAPVATFRGRHLALLSDSFDGAPFADDALGLLEATYDGGHETIGALARASLMALADYFDLTGERQFIDSGTLFQSLSSTDRVLAIVQALGGTSYVTGHGARNYLDHGRFEANGISVDYMDYQKIPYAQGHGAFTPYVTGLDLVAWRGRAGRELIVSGTVSHKELAA